MRRWKRTVVTLVWAGGMVAALPAAQAGQLPDDVHPGSRSRLPPVAREELDAARRDAYDTTVRGPMPDGRGAAAALRWHGSGTNLRWSAPIGRRLTELTILTAAREYDQPFEWALHELEALAVGLEPGIIDIVRHRRPLRGLADRDAIIVEVGRELFGTHRLSSGTYDRALKLLGKTNLVDVVDVMGRYAGRSCLGRTTSVPRHTSRPSASSVNKTSWTSSA